MPGPKPNGPRRRGSPNAGPRPIGFGPPGPKPKGRGTYHRGPVGLGPKPNGLRRQDLLGLVPYGPIQTVLTLGYFTLSALAYVDFPSELSLEIYHVVTILRLG